MNFTKSQRKAIISALFVISAVILAVLGISLLTSPQPRTNTQFNITTTESQVLITHTGGESLQCDLLSIRLNGEEIRTPLKSLTNCPWSIGEILAIPFTHSDRLQTIRILYRSGESPTELLYVGIPGRTPLTETVTLPGPTLTPAIPTTIPASTLSPTAESTPGIPVASFSASPRSGSVPLIVQFTDTSTGVPAEWFWSFGDGTVSMEEDPVHVYPAVGSYQVSLRVNNTYGAHTRIANGYINVTPASGRDVFIEAERGGSVVPGGFLEWTVVSPVAWIKIGGQVRNLEPGDRIRLVVEGDGKGKISVQNGAILEFSFEEVSFYRDGSHIARGSVREISVPGSSDFVSSLRLVIPPGSGTIRVLEEGAPKPVPGTGSALVADSLRPGRDGMMSLDCFRPDYTHYRGTTNPLPI
ncbi:MAG: PKD domain-containing protein [Methanolinea sp.]|nr:PKD domain-containing protein [Methanolinea sp.]